MNFELVDCEIDTADDEPSLGAGEEYFATMDQWQRPHWEPRPLFSAAVPLGSQDEWAACSTFDVDRENEHDGIEPENEHATDLDHGEDDGLTDGERDDSDYDDGRLIIEGGGSGPL